MVSDVRIRGFIPRQCGTFIVTRIQDIQCAGLKKRISHIIGIAIVRCKIPVRCGGDRIGLYH